MEEFCRRARVEVDESSLKDRAHVASAWRQHDYFNNRSGKQVSKVKRVNAYTLYGVSSAGSRG